MNKDLDFSDNKIDTYKDLLLRRDYLKKEREHIWLEYIREFGNLIEEMLKAKIDCIALKKKISYCQARQNRNETIILSEMECEIESAIADYFEELNHIKIIKDSKSTLISNYEFLQIKKLYRKIATMIHPDLHPELFKNSEIQELWHNAKTEYNANDYEGLMETEFLIYQAIKEYTPQANKEFTIDDIDIKIQSLHKEIEQIVSSNPYKYKYILENKELIVEEQNQIEQETAQYKNYLKELTKIFAKYNITEIIN